MSHICTEWFCNLNLSGGVFEVCNGLIILQNRVKGEIESLAFVTMCYFC